MPETEIRIRPDAVSRVETLLSEAEDAAVAAVQLEAKVAELTEQARMARLTYVRKRREAFEALFPARAPGMETPW